MCRQCTGRGRSGEQGAAKKLARWLGDLENNGRNHVGVAEAGAHLDMDEEQVWDIVKHEKRTNGQPKFMGAIIEDVERVALAVVVQRAGIPEFQFVE